MRSALGASRVDAWTVLALLLAAPAAGMLNEPIGLAKAKFGMSVAEVRAAYPQLEELTRGLGATVVRSPLVGRYVLWKHAVPGLAKAADVELRFWTDKLWVVVVYFGDNDPDTVVAALAAQYGPPSSGGASPIWHGAKATVVVAREASWYSINDNALSRDAEAVLMEDYKRAMAARAARAPDAGPHGTNPTPVPARPPSEEPGKDPAP